MSDYRAYEQSAVLAVVVSGHLLLILAFLYLNKRDDPSASVDGRNRSILILIEAEPAKRIPIESRPIQMRPADVSRALSPDRTRAITPPSVESDRSATAITVPPPQAPIDWYGEGERSARTTADKLGHTDHRPFGEQREPLQPGDKPHQFEWNPEPKTVGVAGLLPYVRLGKRCVLGLGFFGCAIGKLPEANGDLFEGMHDPDRPESSVPDSR